MKQERSSHGVRGYDQCRALTGADFENVFNLHLWAANAKLINYYMIYGYEYVLSLVLRLQDLAEGLHGVVCLSQAFTVSLH